MASSNKTAPIARLNDSFRTSLASGQVMLTSEAQALDELILAEVLKAVQ